MARYYPLRRIPEAARPGHFARRMLPLIPAILRSAAWTLAASGAPPGSPMREVLQAGAVQRGDQALEKAQDTFFAEPGLDTLLVRELSKLGSTISRWNRVRLWTYIALGFDRDGRAARNLRRIPRMGYDSLMLTGLAFGKSLGYFTGGKVHAQLWWDSQGEVGQLPPEHPTPQVRRFQPPRSLGDLAADIDDLYWADAYGQAVKITQVGRGSNRRWLVSVPGTDHPEPESKPNVADLETNLREELNLPSAMRRGVIAAVNQAMAAAGIEPSARVHERVLVCGHSQGGMVAVGLAATAPAELGFDVEGVITMGSPTRRLRLRPSVDMLALEHVQDVVPALDGTPRKVADQRVVVQRSLVKPRLGSLYYAHASSTYTDTLRQLERRVQITRWGREAQVVEALQRYLPQPGEETRVTHHYIWQELVPTHANTAWTEYLELDRPDWEPVVYGDEVVSPELPPTPQELMEKVEAALENSALLAQLSRPEEAPRET